MMMNGHSVEREMNLSTSEYIDLEKPLSIRGPDCLRSKGSSEGINHLVPTNRNTGGTTEKGESRGRENARNESRGEEGVKLKSHREIDPLVNNIVPTAVVIKNIPISMRKETFLEILLELDIPKPSAINYHRDNGVFRGLAFANFRTPEETAFVISLLNGFDIAGRKLRIEYKLIGAGLPKESHNELGTTHCKETQPVDKNNAIMLKRREKSATASSSEKDEDMERKFMDKSEKNEKTKIEEHKFTSDKDTDDIDMSIPDARSFYEELVAFRDEDGHHDLVYLNSLNLYQRALLQLIVQKLDMSYKCDGEDENWHMRISRKGAPNSVSILSTGKTLKKTLSGNSSSDSISGLGKTPLKANHGSVGISVHGSRSPFRQNLRRVDGLPSVCPVRQPRGPDLSQNFALRRSLRD